MPEAGAEDEGFGAPVTSDLFETVAFVYDLPQLSLLLSLLESEDIWVVPASYRHATVQFTMMVALGGVQLRVHESDAAAARRVLSHIDPSLSPRPIFSDNRFVEILLILGLFLVGFFAPPARIHAHFPPGPSSAAARRK